MPVALDGPARAALIGGRPDLLGGLGFDECLVDELGALADDVEVAASSNHVEQLTDVRLEEGHRVSPSVGDWTYTPKIAR